MIHRSSGVCKREYDGNVEFKCEECGGTVATAQAMSRSQLVDGLRWLGAPCDQCPRTYTVEIRAIESDEAA